VYLCGSVLVDVREGRFRDVPVATSHAIVRRLVNFAEVCGGLGKAPLEDSHEVLEALVASRLLLHTSSASPQTASSPSAWIVRNVWVVRIVRMVAGIVRTEAEAALVGAWGLKLIVVELGGGVAPAGSSQSTAPIMSFACVLS
jgi:hypothetical protein